MDDEPEVKYNLRLPESVYKGVVKRAEKNRRSINSELIIMLEAYFDDSKAPGEEETAPERPRTPLEVIEDEKRKEKGKKRDA